jgi:hypothetical protein
MLTARQSLAIASLVIGTVVGLSMADAQTRQKPAVTNYEEKVRDANDMP